MSDSYERIESLSRDKRRLLELLVLEQQPKAQPVLARRNSASAPLSFSQQRFWFFDQFAPGNAVHNLSSVLRLGGVLDIPALQWSLDELVRRHEALRTTFPTVDGRPEQVWAPAQPASLTFRDLSEVPEPERDAEALRLAAEDGQRPFDLARGPLLRVCLLRLGSQHHLLIFTTHHIVSDGWSQGIIVNELSQLYSAFLTNTFLELPELPVQYADFTEWERERLQGETLDESLAYWRNALDGIVALELPFVRPRPAVQGFQSAGEKFELSESLTHALQLLSRSEGVTLFMTLLAAFKMMLSRYSRQDDISVGSPVANRTRMEIEGVVGCFVNMVVLRTRLSGDLTIRELLALIREVCVGAYAHSDLPFERVVNELQPERNLNRNPLFQVAFALMNAPVHDLDLPGLTLSSVELEQGLSENDLTLMMVEENGCFAGQLSYRTDLFDPATIKRMLTHWQRALELFVVNRDQRLSELQLLSETELKQIRHDWNETRAGYDLKTCVHEVFEQQASRTPGAVAVAGLGRQLSYLELNRQANRLAHYLQRLDVGPEVRVGVCLERSVEMVVALLGILKAGGAYVPMDPSYPSERLAFMLEDSQASVVLTREALLNLLPAGVASMVCMDSDREAIEGERDDEPQCDTTLDNLSYVIYTSGSTGRPNAVEVSHRSLLNLVGWHQQRFAVTAADRATLVAAPAFDASVWELWPYLTAGASVHLPDDEIRLSPEQLKDWFLSERISLSFLPTPLASALVKLEWPGGLALRSLLTGGDKLQQHAPLALPFELVNNYGPTECTVVTTSCVVAANEHGEDAPPIGRPIANMEVYLLDERMQPVPIGVVGEIWIGGAGLARGYLNRPSLTAERFRPHPFSSSTGARLYRSGDLGRYLPDGNVEYIGRLDEQVKLRGYRIEPGEVEATLAQHPSVRAAVAVVREERQGNKALAAYVELRTRTEADSAGLREFLKERLPEYMVPSAIVFLDELPLTVNGKYDRRALAALELRGAQPPESFVAPRNEAEKLLAGIWSEVLGIETIGVHDNFFNLGGDSILSIEVTALARKAGLGISVQQLFQCQTIHELARIADQLDARSSVTAATAPFSLISKQDRAHLPPDVVDAYPLIQMQSGMLFHSQYTDKSTFYHNIFTYHLRGPCDLEALSAVLAELLDRNAVLRTSFDLTGYSEPLQLVHPAVPVPLEYEDLCHLTTAAQERMIEEYIEADKLSHFDLERAPLLRVRVHRRSEATYQFTISFHHVILDGLSNVRLNVELFNQFVSRLEGTYESLPPPPPPVTFRDYVSLELDALRSGECRTYWTRKLEGSTITKLPRFAADRREVNDRTVRSLTVPLTDAQSESLRRLAQAEDVPLKSVLLAAHMRVMSLHGGQPDVMTGLISNGRPETTGGERLLGLFLNTLPFRLQLHGGAWSDLIRETFEAERDALPFRRFPIAEIQHLHPSGQPLFETCFNFTHYHFYQGIQETGRIEVLDSSGTSETNFTLLTNFSVDAVSSIIRLGFDYNPVELCGEQVEAIARHYVATLDAMSADPQARYEVHCPLSDAERRQLLVEWNANAAPCPQTQHLHEQFEARAARTPECFAVVADEIHLSYGELNRQANRLAHYLRALGVGAEMQVGICMRRTPEMIVGILGTLKAGAAYLPLDPAYPKERLGFMLDDSRAAVLLTERHLAETLPPHRARVIFLDADDAELARYDDHNPVIKETPDKLAYVIYTSGSTGRPKSVGIQHRSAVAFLDWAKTVFSEADLAGVLFATSICFDLSVFELFAPLSAGGTVVLAENALHLPSLTRAGEVTLINLVPSALEEILRVDGIPESVTTVNLAGEPLSLELVRAAYQTKNIDRVFNLYGPSEDTTYSTGILLDKESSERPPIGRPIANTQVYLLDTHLQPVPIGAPGTLYLGGAGLARGYLNDSHLTAEKFIPDPFSNSPGCRIYNTGDLARYLPDGNLEFLGRVDQQVKIRGFRIEPGEIESVLKKHPGVEQAVVLTTAHPSGGKRLVAYVVLKENDRAVMQNLQSYVSERLPTYMIPSAFVSLEKLPLTPNGKLDRAALPAPEASSVERQDASTLPRNVLELKLMQLWEELLGLNSVGIRDNFFLDLGGHSILAVRLIAMIEKRLGRRLSLSTLLQGPTVEQLARVMHLDRDAVSPSPLIAINPNGSRPPFFCVHPATGGALCYVHLARHLGSDQPFYGMQALGLDGQEMPLTSIEELAGCYIAALQKVQPVGPYFLGGHSFGGIVAFEMAQQLKRMRCEVALVAILDTMAPVPHPDSAPDSNVQHNDAQLLCEIAKVIERFLKKKVNIEYQELRLLGFQDQLSFVLNCFKEIDLFPQDAGITLIRGLLQVEKANMRAVQGYVPQVYPGKITLFRAATLHDDDFMVSSLPGFKDPSAGWAALSSEQLDIHVVDGDHITMITETNVSSLAAKLRPYLDWV